MDAIVTTPQPLNEPVGAFAPGSAERAGRALRAPTTRRDRPRT